MAETAAERASRPTPSTRLRVGVVLDSHRPAAWIHRLLVEVEESTHSGLEAVVVLQAPAPPSAGGSGGRLLGLVEQLDARLLAAQPDALARSDLGVAQPVLRSETVATAAEAVRHLGGLELDVVLALDSRCGGLERCAAHGVWSVGFGDPLGREGEAPSFWELHDRSSVGVAVIRADTTSGSHILYRGTSSVDPVSLQRNRSIGAWKAGRALLLRLQELHALGPDSLLAHAEPAPAVVATDDRPIRLRNVVRVAATMARSGLARFLDWRFRRGEWLVAYRSLSGEGWPPWQSASPYRLLASPPGRWLADPFLYERDGRHILFVEDFVEARGKAVISWLELGPEGPRGDPQTALEREYHLSYPFVFEWEDDVYLIPESTASKRVELYRAEAFPDRWSLAGVLLEGVAADDATLLRHEGRFWLFAGIAPEGTSALHSEVFLFSSETLGTDWRPHPWNPIVTDVRAGRPAGRVFRHDGVWIRPAQDCSSRYGYATVFNRIEELTVSTYRESRVAYVGPEWLSGNLGTHTYNRDSLFETVDGYRQHWRRPSSSASP